MTVVFPGRYHVASFRVVYRVSMGGCLMRQQRKRTIWNTGVSIFGEHFWSEECFKKEKEKLEVWVFNVFMVWINM